MPACSTARSGAACSALFGLFFPPVGLLIAAGPIAGALASGATLGAAGALTVGAVEGIIGGLVHLGLPHEVATRFGEHVHKGDTLVIAHASSDALADQAQQVLEGHRPRAETSPSGVVSATAQGS